MLLFRLNPKHEESDVQLIPFRDIVNALASPVDKTQLLAAAANVLLFMPFGAALNMRGLSLRKTALVGFALTACVEGAQLLFSRLISEIRRKRSNEPWPVT